MNGSLSSRRLSCFSSSLGNGVGCNRWGVSVVDRDVVIGWEWWDEGEGRGREVMGRGDR